MSERLAGQRVLVTGAAQGIGRACVQACHAGGADVLATDIAVDGLRAIEGRRIQVLVADCTDAAAVNALAESVGKVDSVVHCVGYVDQGKILECDEARWTRSFTVNASSFFHVVRAFLPGMRKQRRGSIVCISSVASSIKGFSDRAAYGATKAALIGLVKSIAVDYVADGVRCNAVCPGTVDTPSLQQRVAELGRSVGGMDKALQSFVSRQPMGRLCTPEEVADLCLYLVSDESRFVTGQAIRIDGGITM